MGTVGIRREDKNKWERRVPLTPEHVSRLSEQEDLEFLVQPSRKRVFTDQEYEAAGARVGGDLTPCRTVFAIKEIPADLLRPGVAYVFFSHTIKGQPQNMYMLRRLMDLGCHLIDYERLVDEKGRRLVLFGWHAGVAGMIDTLWSLGRRLEWEGISNPFSRVKQALEYGTLEEAREELLAVGESIRAEGLPPSIAPLVFGFAGYGNVSRGAQEILEILPTTEVDPAGLADIGADGEPDRHSVYKVVFKEEHTVVPADPEAEFDLEEFFSNPKAYRSVFDKYVPHLSVLMNAVYWQPGSPRLLTTESLAKLYAGGATPRLRVIGDISCDVDGAVQCTVKGTGSDNPVFVFEPETSRVIDGIAGRGPVVLAVDNLPAELPRESSEGFSTALLPFVAAIANADFDLELDSLDLPPEVMRALILHKGRLTPDYEYLLDHLMEHQP